MWANIYRIILLPSQISVNEIARITESLNVVLEILMTT